MNYSNNLGRISKYKINSYTAKIYAANTNRIIKQDASNGSTKHKCDENLVVNLKNVYSNIRSTTVCMTDQISEDVRLNISRTTSDKTVKKLKNISSTLKQENNTYFSNDVSEIDKKDIKGENKKGKIIVPSTHDVYRNSKIGKISRDHSFTSEASFEHVLIFLLRSNYLPDKDKNNLLESHVLFNHLNKMIDWSKNIDFMNLKNPIKNYAHQEKINPHRVKKFLAATLTYNLDIPTVIRFLGGNYTGEYRNINHTINSFNESKCDPKKLKK